VERTYAMIKPDAVAAGHVDSILAAIRASGFTICAEKRLRLTQADAASFYKEHEGKPFFAPLIAFMTRYVGLLFCLRLIVDAQR